MTPQDTAEALHRAVDQLIQRQRIRLQRDDTGRSEWHTVPSLWEQLEAATGYQGTGTGGRSGPERMPISADVVQLVIDIAATLSEAVLEHAGQSRHTVPGNLRLLAARIVTDPDADVDWWATKIGEWVRDARAALRLNPPRPRWARGARCPDCGSDTVSAHQDGEVVRRPALSIQWAAPTGDDYHADSDWRVRAVTCDACGTSWWRGADLDHLVGQMLAANATRETMTG